PTLIVCTVPLALMLKLIVSLTPNVPGFWLLISVSAPAVPLLIAWIASRRDTLPSLGVLSSAVVVTVIMAGAWRSSSFSRRKGVRRRPPALVRNDVTQGRPIQFFILYLDK